MFEDKKRRAVLIQDIRDFTSYLFPILIQISKDYPHLKIQSEIGKIYYWILCELTEIIYCYSVIGHRKEKYKQVFDILINTINQTGRKDLEQLFSFYVKGPAYYTTMYIVDAGVSPDGSDFIFTYYWSKEDFQLYKDLTSFQFH